MHFLLVTTALLLWGLAAILGVVALMVLGERRNRTSAMREPVRDRDPGDENTLDLNGTAPWNERLASDQLRAAYERQDAIRAVAPGTFPFCPKCRSTDINVRAKDGATWCNACQRVYYPSEVSA